MRLRVFGNLKRLVDGVEQVVGEVGRQIDELCAAETIDNRRTVSASALLLEAFFRGTRRQSLIGCGGGTGHADLQGSAPSATAAFAASGPATRGALDPPSSKPR
jgi:hypothetical protein